MGDAEAPIGATGPQRLTSPYGGTFNLFAFKEIAASA
jgi:hypothetical protein